MCLVDCSINQQATHEMKSLISLVEIFIASALLFASLRAQSVKSEWYETNATIILNGVLCDLKSKVPISGTLLIRHENGSVSKEIEYVSGRINGHSIRYTISGSILSKETWKDGLEDGISTYYYPPNQGIRKIMSYKNGLLDGEFREYYPSGAIHKEGCFVSNKKSGRWSVYTETGEVIERVSFEDGILHSDIVGDQEAKVIFDFLSKERLDSLRESLERMPKDALKPEPKSAEGAKSDKELNDAWNDVLKKQAEVDKVNPAIQP